MPNNGSSQGDSGTGVKLYLFFLIAGKELKISSYKKETTLSSIYP